MTAAWPVLVGVGVAVGVAIVMIARRLLLPSAAEFGSVLRGLKRVQRSAFRNVKPAGAPPEMGADNPQYFLSPGGAGVYYTVTLQEGKFLHHVSLKLRRLAWYRKRSIHYSLIILLELTRQHGEAFGEDQGPEVEIQQSELGTIHHAFVLSADQQKVYQEKLDSEPRSLSG